MASFSKRPRSTLPIRRFCNVFFSASCRACANTRFWPVSAIKAHREEPYSTHRIFCPNSRKNHLHQTVVRKMSFPKLALPNLQRLTLTKTCQRNYPPTREIAHHGRPALLACASNSGTTRPISSSSSFPSFRLCLMGNCCFFLGTVGVKVRVTLPWYYTGGNWS